MAARAGFPRGARLAVAALRQVPTDQPVPWHRVLRADGRIAFAASHPNYAKQVQRLRAEGVLVDKGRVDLTQFGWADKASDEPSWWLPADEAGAPEDR